MILEKIVAHKRKEISRQKEALPLPFFMQNLLDLLPPRSLINALRQPGEVTLLAEIKRASPSKGLICSNFDPAEISAIYTRAGAAGISVLTDEEFFGGRADFLPVVRQNTTLPVLRKDFIIDPYQIYESRLLGADAILLIVAILSDQELISFYYLASELGLDCLVEVHTKEELERALNIPARLIGINNRNLYTFEVDLTTTFRLRPYITSKEVVVVSESGIKNRDHMLALKEYGVDAVLVGEALMGSPDIEMAVKELLGTKQ